MNKFDIDEQNIYDMFSQITVDSSNMAEKVKNRLHDETPQIAVKEHNRWARSTVVAIVMSALLVVTATAATLGKFDWFIEKFNPDFGKIVEPVEVYSEDQGIRMEIIGAQKYGNRAIVYLSLQDITGQNRLTEHTDFQDGFRIKMNPEEKDKNTSGKEILLASASWKQNMIYFDEDTNTIYYEFNIVSDLDTPLADPLEIGSTLIYFDGKDYEGELVSLSSIKMETAETVSLRETQLWGGMDLPDDLDLPIEVLKPGYYADMPYGEKDQWISNIGIINGDLHVQIGKILNKEFGSSDAELGLMCADGEPISYDYTLEFLGDKDHRIIDTKNKDYGDSLYSYEEFIFSIDPKNLNEYILGYTVSVSSGVKGKWNVIANLSDSKGNTRIWTNSIPIDGHLFEHMVLSPLGLQVIGSYEGEECIAQDMSIELETPDGIISLEYGGGSQNYENHTFSSNWDTKTPLDINKVIAIIINGTRIPIS